MIEIDACPWLPYSSLDLNPEKMSFEKSAIKINENNIWEVNLESSINFAFMI
tara:strand:- start:4840 stop:4995 length:156 start_codon:yes stop_codon:yes gene_type:complete